MRKLFQYGVFFLCCALITHTGAQISQASEESNKKTLEIIYNNNAKQTVPLQQPSANIVRMEFKTDASADTLCSAAPDGKTLLFEDFTGNIGEKWSPFGVAGGSFKKFAKVENNTLQVSVPQNNSWGKTGIMSKKTLFTVDNSMAANPLKMEFTFDPDQTTGYVIAFSKEAEPDVWLTENVWFHWYLHNKGYGRALITNSQDESGKVGANLSSPVAPQKVLLSVRPGIVDACSSNGINLSFKAGWLKPGSRLYLYVFSHPWDENQKASFALKSIKLVQ